MSTLEPPREYADCEHCGGRIVRGGYKALVLGDGWTHLNREDWVNNVHPAEPVSDPAGLIEYPCPECGWDGPHPVVAFEGRDEVPVLECGNPDCAVEFEAL